MSRADGLGQICHETNSCATDLQINQLKAGFISGSMRGSGKYLFFHLFFRRINEHLSVWAAPCSQA